ncbi:MAG: 2-oxo acid dehydrogenase subunit E2 [Chloroflexota bacterium]|nr:2-oxo acid dehydrogenase subunit E2 [Chloroflexota bacterium]
MQEFKLPDLGEGMEEAEIRRWLVGPGDAIKTDQLMVQVETDKALVEIPSPVTGRVADIRVPEGQVAKKGAVLIVFETASRNGGIAPAKNANPAPAAVLTSASNGTDGAEKAATAKRRVLAAPAVRKLAFELDVDLEQVQPSNANGRVSIEDVRAYAEEARTPASSSTSASEQQSVVLSQPQQRSVLPAPIPEDKREPLTGLRKRIAEHMEYAWRTIPHATAFDEVDGSGLVALRRALLPVAEKRGVRLTYMPLLLKLLLPVLKEFPIFNASLDEERREIVYKQAYHIGVATAAPEGLLVPVLRDADRLTLLGLASELERLVEGARKRSLSRSELTGSTFTLNNVGSFGGASGTPIINHPEVAILAVGKLQEKAVVHEGQLVARPMMPLALSFDHRLIDGARAGAFLARFKELVENPQQLLLDML